MDPRPILDYLRELERGALHADLSTAFHEVVAAVRKTGNGGALTLTLAVKPQDADNETVTVTPTIAVKTPMATRRATLYFVDQHDNLTRRDPRQGDIEDVLREAK